MTVETNNRLPEYSDEALALRFATAHAKDLRYIAARRRWYMWSGTVWEPDNTLAVYDLVRHECRAVAAEITARNTSATAKRQATNITSARAVAAVERLARSDRRLAATVSQLKAGALSESLERTINRARPAQKGTP